MGRKPVDKERADNPRVKEKWIKILAPVYFQNGLRKFTMDDIAGKLGISKATLYKYFASREEILHEIVQYKIAEIEVFEDDLRDENIDFTERFFDIIKGASFLLAEISERFLSETKETHPELWQRINQFQDRALFVAEAFYRRGIESGNMHADLNPRLLALTDKMFIRSVSNRRFLKEYEVSLKEAFDGFYLMKSRGIFKQGK